MRATKAYIASLGTTGVLLAAAVLMLGVVGAVVAFDAWPNGHISTRVQTLLIAERPPATIRVTPAAGRSGASARAARAGTAGGTRAVRRGTRPAIGRGVIAPAPLPGQATTPRTTTVAPALPNATLPLGAPPLVSPGTQGLAGQVADQTQAASGQAGTSLARVDPATGQAVSSGGQQAADAVRQLPLP